MIDPLSEDTFPLSAIGRRLPRLRRNRPIHPSTGWRWAERGLKGIRLETIKIGGVTCTSAEALRRFFAALTGCPPKLQQLPTRRRELRQADAELAREGI